MVVIYKNQFFTLNMRYLVFENLRTHCPQCEVEIETLTDSTYKEQKKVPVGELKDHSVERNLAALGK